MKLFKQFSIILILMALASCGTARKRTTHKTTTPEQKKSSVVRNGEDDYPMPRDNGKFMHYPITSIEEYITTFADIAKFEMKAYGIPASITLAQGLLESGFGRGSLTRKTNNHFGIKCHTGWEGDYENHDDDEKGECFRKYNHPMYSFRDHSIFLSSRSRYASLFDLNKADYKGWARGLKSAGYATDRKYPQKLINIIETYQLYEYDKDVLGDGYTFKSEVTDTDYTTYVVKKGDTLYAISRRYQVSLSDLMEVNDLQNADLFIGQVLRIKSENSKK